MQKIEVYDPAMCCSTGVCGPSVDPELARFAADLAWLRSQGAEVARYNLAQEPRRFSESAAVTGALRERGTDCLPLIVVDGRIVAEGVRPSRDVLAALAGLMLRKPLPVAPAQGCCCTPAQAPAPGAPSSCC